MCQNVGVCWSELAFGSKNDLQMLCEAQGFTFSNEGAGTTSGNMVVIRSPPKNITVSEGATAAFRCSADFAVRVVLSKRSDTEEDTFSLSDGSNPSTQTTIQEIEEARMEHVGWYVCTAFGAGGTSVSSEAYLEIRDICKDNNCVEPKVCQSDQYAGTYECVCPSDCSNDFVPVCGSNCESYFNKCTMKKETCEKGLIGIRVLSKGMCNFAPTPPEWLEQPKGGSYKEGQQVTWVAKATGTPEPNYKWMMGSKVLQDGSGTFSAQIDDSMRGKLRVIASNCYSNVIKHSFTVDVEATQLKEPEGSCCKVYGDPHIITFDQVKYDYMGVGAFILAQEKESALWQVYGTLAKCGDVTKDVSCITGITVIYKATMVEFLRMWRINYNGADSSLKMGQTKDFGDISVENRKMKYYITIGDTGVVVTWDGIVTSKICIAKCGGGVSGLCGDGDCDASNDYSRRGFMNPYTGSWEARNSDEFSNSWSVDPEIGSLVPEDGALAPERKRPCAALPAALRAEYEGRCQAVLDLSAFSVVAMTTINSQLAYADCVFDSCAGLVWGAGCADKSDSQCRADIEAAIAGAMAEGMSRADAIAKYQPIVLDPACMMGISLGSELGEWGAVINNDWRSELSPVCPSDEEISLMQLCPTL